MIQKAKSICCMSANVLLAMLLTSCFTMKVMNRQIAETNYPALSDTIYAIGKPDTASSKAIGDPHVIAFLGYKNSYVLLEGGETLMMISDKLDGNRIEIDSQSPKLYLKDKTIFGQIVITYNAEKSKTFDETSKLKNLGFIQSSINPNLYEKSITIKGSLGPTIQIPENKSSGLKHSRQISFYNPPSSVVVPKIKQVALMPLAIAGDIATSPVQIVGFVVLFLIFSGLRG